MTTSPQVAFVHDYINQWGGAEQVLATLHALYPTAPVYTLFADRTVGEQMGYTAEGDPRRQLFDLVKTSGLQQLPRRLQNWRGFLPLYPTAMENFELTPYDVVISDSSAFAKGVVTRPDAVHISYCHSPTRYLWDWHARYLKEQRLNPILSAVMAPLLNYLRVWDFWAADRVDVFVANSRAVQERIEKFYQRPAEVIYPPVDVLSKQREIPGDTVSRQPAMTYHSLEETRPYYLVVGRLSAYKKVELAIEACNRLQVPLAIVGGGRESRHLHHMAWDNVRFYDQVSRTQLEDLYRGAKALIMPGKEDFGMVMVEAMSFGKPVIAFGQGGALEIVEPGMSGELFAEETVRSLMDAIRLFEHRWDRSWYQPAEIFRSVTKFDRKYFTQQFENLIAKTREQHARQLSDAGQRWVG